MGKIDEITELAARLAGDAPPVAGYLTYNPGPGIYSRMERAVEALPENVRVQELPGLLKRYKDGIPGWELKAVDLDSVVAGRDVVPRSDILAAVKERSPVYTHREVVLGESGPRKAWPGLNAASQEPGAIPLSEFPEPLRMGAAGTAIHGQPAYKEYGQGGADYKEILLSQPGAAGQEYGNHWSNAAAKGVDEAVAHARFDTHGDALRINELQSDLGIHNRKIREKLSEPGRVTARYPDGTVYALDEFGIERPVDPQIPFPLEDAWSDLLIKRLALEAARQGHRAIEVASPRAIADKVGGNIDNYAHFYGKVVPGSLERLGRKMGGLTPDDASTVPEFFLRPLSDSPQYQTHQPLRDQFRAVTGDEQPGPNFWRLYSGMRYDSLSTPEQAFTYDRFGGSHPVSQVEGGLPQEMYDYLHSLGLSPQEAQGITSQAMYLAPHNARAMHNSAVQEQLQSLEGLTKRRVGEVGRRYIMSDEMRKRILTEGIPAAVAIGIGTDQVLDRLDREAPKAQMR